MIVYGRHESSITGKSEIWRCPNQNPAHGYDAHGRPGFFLLITFFIFNSVVSKPSAMQLLLPADGPSAPSAETRTLTVLLAQNGEAVCYEGFAHEPSGIHKINLFNDQAALRNIITKKRQALAGKAALMVIIKPGSQSNYRQLVAALDEMTISGVKKYAMAEMDESDKKLLTFSR